MKINIYSKNKYESEAIKSVLECFKTNTSTLDVTNKLVYSNRVIVCYNNLCINEYCNYIAGLEDDIPNIILVGTKHKNDNFNFFREIFKTNIDYSNSDTLVQLLERMLSKIELINNPFVEFGNIYRSCLKTKFDLEYPNSIKDILVALSKNYKNINDDASHSRKGKIEKDIKEVQKDQLGVKYFDLVEHWFNEDMANNFLCSLDKFKINNTNEKILIIDDNLDRSTLFQHYASVIELIKYKTNFRGEFNSDLITNELYVNRFNDLLEGASSRQEIRVLTIGDKDKNGHDITSESPIEFLKNYRYIFVDLLVGDKLLGFNIIKNLIKLQKYNPKELKFEILVVSRSTNTEDIQRALNEGASLFIPKERIFSIPYRISQLGPHYPDFSLRKRVFKNLYKFPERIQKGLREHKIRWGDKVDKEWITKLPKADLHCHLGGSMDAKITLELSLYTSILTIIQYLEHNNFVIEDDENGKLVKCKSGTFDDICNNLNPSINIDDLNTFLSEIWTIADKYKKYIKYWNELSSRKDDNEARKALKNVSSPEIIFQELAKKYAIDFLGLQSYHVTSIFNLFLVNRAKDFKNIEKNSLLEDIMYLLNFDSESKNLPQVTFSRCRLSVKMPNSREYYSIMENVLQATHGNDLSEAVGGITLKSFLQGCEYTGSDVMQTRYTIKRAIEYICNQAREDNVYYLSLRITPLNFTRGGLSADSVWKAFKAGYNSFRLNNKNSFLILTIIIALKRHYKTDTLNENIKIGGEYILGGKKNKLPKDNIKYFENGLPTKEFQKKMPFVSGYDLTGLEAATRPENFRKNFKNVFKQCKPITIHAGEETESSFIWEAAYELNANRIGHGLSLADDKNLQNHFKDFKKVIELCPSSNYLTQEKYANNTKEYPLRIFINGGLEVVICSDDPAIQGVRLSEEFIWGSEMLYTIKGETYRLSRWEVLHLIYNSFKYCFLDYDIKKELMSIIDSDIHSLLLSELN